MSHVAPMKLHPLALFAAANSSPAAFGVLLGHKHNGDVVVHTCFEIVVQNGAVDAAYLARRLAQFHTVLPDYALVGVYQLAPAPTPATSAVLEQIGVDDISVLLVDWTADQALASFHWTAGTLAPAHAAIVADDIENIAISTVTGHPQYLVQNSARKNIDDVDFAALKQQLNSSIAQLAANIDAVLDHLKKGPPSVEVNNLTAQLCRKLDVVKRLPEADFSDNLYASELALLTSKLVALEKLQVLVHENISRARVKSRMSANPLHLMM